MARARADGSCTESEQTALSEFSPPSMSYTRRAFMRGAAGSIGLLTFVVAGCEEAHSSAGEERRRPAAR